MRIVKAIDKIERILITVLFSVMVAAVFGQVVNRNWLKLNISWFEELARGCMIYMLMLGTEMSLREKSQLNVDSLVRRLPSKVKQVFDYFSVISVIIFTGVIGIASFRLIKTLITRGGVMPALQIPRYWFQGCVTVGCLLAFITQVIILINTILHHLKKAKTADEKEAAK